MTGPEASWLREDLEPVLPNSTAPPCSPYHQFHSSQVIIHFEVRYMSHDISYTFSLFTQCRKKKLPRSTSFPFWVSNDGVGNDSRTWKAVSSKPCVTKLRVTFMASKFLIEKNKTLIKSCLGLGEPLWIHMQRKKPYKVLNKFQSIGLLTSKWLQP